MWLYPRQKCGSKRRPPSTSHRYLSVMRSADDNLETVLSSSWSKTFKTFAKTFLFHFQDASLFPPVHSLHFFHYNALTNLLIILNLTKNVCGELNHLKFWYFNILFNFLQFLHEMEVLLWKNAFPVSLLLRFRYNS